MGDLILHISAFEHSILNINYILVIALHAFNTLTMRSMYCISQYVPTNDTLFTPGTLCSVAARISYGMFQYLWQSVHILHLSLFYVKRRINIIYSMVCFKMQPSRVCTTSLSIFWQMAHSFLIKWKLVSKQFQMAATKASVHTVYSLKNNGILYYLKIKVMTRFVSFSR